MMAKIIPPIISKIKQNESSLHSSPQQQSQGQLSLFELDVPLSSSKSSS